MDITSANSVFMLSITNLFPVAQRLTKYAAEAMFATEAVETAQVGKGADGNMFAGYTPYNTPQRITLMPDSPQLTMFLQWLATMKATQGILTANATLAIPSISQKWTLTTGVLTRAPAIPTAQKVLQAMEFEITWDQVDPAPF
jgi:hypothetical protein